MSIMRTNSFSEIENGYVDDLENNSNKKIVRKTNQSSKIPPTKIESFRNEVNPDFISDDEDYHLENETQDTSNARKVIARKIENGYGDLNILSDVIYSLIEFYLGFILIF